MFVDLSDMMPYSLLYTYQTARYRTVSENTIIPKYHNSLAWKSRFS